MRQSTLITAFLAILFTSTAYGEMIIVSTGKSCTTMTIVRDEENKIIGTTIQTGDCNIPAGVYNVAMTISPDVTHMTVTDGDGKPVTSRTLLSHSNRVVSDLRAYYASPRPTTSDFVAPGPYGELLARTVNGSRRELRISVPSSFFSADAQKRLNRDLKRLAPSGSR